jgi:hypothetical protein
MKHCFITFVSLGGTTYLVKQKKNTVSSVGVVTEALAAYIAKDLNIAHSVEVIPSHILFPGKNSNDAPATIHTVAKGAVLRDLPKGHRYRRLHLKQQSKPEISEHEKGLTCSIIAQMSLRKELAIIVALDSFLGNGARHSGNLMYDDKTDTFCAIDMESSFDKDLCQLAIESLSKIVKDISHNSFSQQELKALKLYRDTLTVLLKKYSAKHLQEMLFYYAEKAGIVPGSRFYQEGGAESKLLLYKNMIAKNYASAQKLVAFLDKILKK